MANRLLLGSRNGDMGFWISRPGYDVLTASDQNMLLSSNLWAMQIVSTGEVVVPAGQLSVTFAIPALGFRPMIILRDEVGALASLTYNAANTAVTLTLGGTSGANQAFGYILLAVNIG